MAKRINKWSLIGIPDHQGVMNVGGRVGAAGGPRAFRRLFAKLRGLDLVRESLANDRDVSPEGTDIAETHERLASAVHQAHLICPLSVVVGGGNDHSYPQLVGVRSSLDKKRQKLGCINIDAHLDVRSATPQITSGSPFRLAIDSGTLDARRFVEFGIQEHCNGPDLWKYVRDHRVQVVPFDELRDGRAAARFKKTLKALAAKCDAVVVSLDLDAAAAAFAPGVSAPQAEGFTAGEIVEMAEFAGAERKVVSFGIFELNPEHDEDDRTARLAATAAWHFIARALKRPAR